MQSTSHTTLRTKSSPMFMPKTHKTSNSSIVGSVCASPTVNKHADPNRPRVIIVDSGITITSTPATPRKRKSNEREEGSVCSDLKTRKRRKTPDSEESSTSSSSRRVEGPSKLMKAARKNYEKFAIRRKNDVVPQLIDPQARVRSVTPSSEKVSSPISNVVFYSCEEVTPTKPLPLARPHPRTKTSMFIQSPVRKPSGPISLSVYARRMSEVPSSHIEQSPTRASNWTPKPIPPRASVQLLPAAF